MAHRSLAIVERAWRGAIEEQYAHILWLTRVLKRMRCDVAVLLRGNAVGYAARTVQPVTLTVAGVELQALHRLDVAVADLLAEGVPVHLSQQDCDRLDILPEQLVPGVQLADPAGIVRLFRLHDRIWYW